MHCTSATACPNGFLIVCYHLSQLKLQYYIVKGDLLSQLKTGEILKALSVSCCLVYMYITINIYVSMENF